MDILSTNNVLFRLAVAVFVYFFFNLLIEKFITNPKHKEIFQVILLIGCVLYIFFGQFLPFK